MSELLACPSGGGCVLLVHVFVLLLTLAGLRAFLAAPRRGLLVLGLVVGAFLLRALIAPRVPVVAANVDFRYALQAARDFDQAVTTGHTGPYIALLTSVMGLVGRSLATAFWTTTAVGALIVIPVFAAAARATRSALAGTVAALVAATLPPLVFFSNGVNLVLPAAFLVAVATSAALAMVDERRTTDIVIYGLSLVLLAMGRSEGPFLTAFLVTTHGLLLGARRHRLRALLKQRGPVLLVLGAASASLVGFLVAQRFDGYLSTLAQPDSGPRTMLAVAIFGVIGLVVVALLWASLRAASRRWRPLQNAWSETVLAATAVLTGLAAATWPDSVFHHTPRLVPDSIGLWLHTTTGLSELPFVPFDAGMFPILLIPLALPALLLPRGDSDDAAGQTGLAVLLFTLCGVMHLFTSSFASSGETIMDGVRYQIPTLPLLAIIVGVGAKRSVALVKGRAAGVAGGLALLLAASPVLTHGATMADVWYDPQREFDFAVRAFQAAPETPLVLLSGHRVATRGPGGRVEEEYDIPELLRSAAWAAGHRVRVAFLDEWCEAPSDFGQGGEVLFFAGTSCSLHEGRESLSPACLWARDASRATVLEEIIPHRCYSRGLLAYPGQRREEHTLALYLLSAEALDRACGALED